MEGFGWFTYEVAKRMVENHPEHEFFFFFDRPFDPKFVFADNVTPVVLNPPARHPILFKIWFDYSVTKALKKYEIDLFFSPDGYLSLRTDVPQVGVIHDLNFEHHPEDLPSAALKYLKKYTPRFAQKAKQLITVSNFSKQDIIDSYGIDEHKITVAYNGASPVFKPVGSLIRSEMQEKYAQGNPFFLFVGALHARKNLKRLLEAYDDFRLNNDTKTQLVIVGEKLWKNEVFESTLNALKHQESIHFTGHLKLDELAKITASAEALTFVSYFEGFGIPIVEAMQCGTPVITGDKTALPEVAGDAAILVDPFNVKEISDALAELDDSPLLQKELSENGLKQAKLFSWDKTAAFCWQVIEKELNKIIS